MTATIHIIAAYLLAWPGAGIASAPAADDPCQSFNRLSTAVRDGTIARDEAKRQLAALIPRIRQYYQAHQGVMKGRDEWIFPVKGYGPGVIGGKNGSGYVAAGYDYFDGNRHGGHPSHDIFIRDANQDSKDDRTGQPVDVLSMTSGVVVSTQPTWEPGSDLRGGIYIWIYDVVTDALVYYAHNSAINVQPGDLVQPGDVLGTVGRTGLNAAKKRSPTHLHITYLKVTDGYPKPWNPYSDMLKMTRK